MLPTLIYNIFMMEALRILSSRFLKCATHCFTLPCVACQTSLLLTQKPLTISPSLPCASKFLISVIKYFIYKFSSDSFLSVPILC
jgi:hypothetical protein